MDVLIEVIIIYIFMFVIDYFILKKVLIIDEYNFMKKLCGLKKKSNPTKKTILISSLINSFIITIVSIFAMHVNLPLYMIFPISFVLLISLIYSLYKIYGNFLKKKQKTKSR